MTGQAKSAPPQDSGSLRKALVQMAAIRGGERFQVVTYSEDDGGADDKLDYASAADAARAAQDYVRGKDGLAYEGALVYDRKQRSIQADQHLLHPLFHSGTLLLQHRGERAHFIFVKP